MIYDIDDDCGAQTVSRRECEHGSLARKCPICALQAENAELRQKLAGTELSHDIGDEIMDDYEAQIEELQTELSTLRESMRWIPVGERLPEIIKVNGNVNFVLVAWNREFRAEYMSAIDVSNTIYLANYSHHATHWMPLPKPPEDSSEAQKRDYVDVETGHGVTRVVLLGDNGEGGQ